MHRPFFNPALLLLPFLALGPTSTTAQPEPEPPAQEAPASTEPLLTFTGDGLTMTIREASKKGAISGDITHGENTYTFTAQFSRDGDTETLNGTFLVNGEAFAFQTRQRDGEPKVTFTSGGQTYMLEALAPTPPADQPANPLAHPPTTNPLATPQPTAPAQPAPTPALLAFTGEGLTVRVRTISDDQTQVTGDLTLDGATYPFTATITADEEATTVQGSFQGGPKPVEFSAIQGEEDEFLTFSIRGRKYQLSEIDPADAPAPTPPTPLPGPARGATAKPTPTAPTAPGETLPAQLKFNKVEFRDINMNNVVAYTMLVPDGWQAQGHIEWSSDKTPYPQRKITITAPDQSRIAFFPASTFSYAESTEVARRESASMGMQSPIPDRQGTPPPESIGAWLVSTIAQTNTEVSNVRLLSDERDQQAETAMAATGQAGPTTWEVHLVTIAFDLGGVPFTEELSLSYARNPPVYTRNINMWDWMLFINSDVRAPSATFAQVKPLLYASSNSLRSVPKWWNQQQLLIMEITRSNHQIGMDEIRRRGQFYDQMSDDSLAAWKKTVTSGDVQQNDRVNTIYEVQDFRDTDGLGVKLPIHYQNYYSDGKGNYLLTNTTMIEPGSEWTKLEPAK